MQDLNLSNSNLQPGKSDVSGLSHEKIVKLETQLKTMTKDVNKFIEC